MGLGRTTLKVFDENMKYSKTYVNAHTFPQKVIGRINLKVFDENMKYFLSWLTFKTYVNAHTFPQKVIGRNTIKVFDENIKYSLRWLTFKTFTFSLVLFNHVIYVEIYLVESYSHKTSTNV